MTPPTRGPFILSLLLITLGVGWLLTEQGIVPQINWVWTLGLGIAGVLTFVVCGGIDKFSAVVGPMFLTGSLLSVLRQQAIMATSTEFPVLFIALGALMLIAQSPQIVSPQWLLPRDAQT